MRPRMLNSADAHFHQVTVFIKQGNIIVGIGLIFPCWHPVPAVIGKQCQPVLVAGLVQVFRFPVAAIILIASRSSSESPV